MSHKPRSLAVIEGFGSNWREKLTHLAFQHFTVIRSFHAEQSISKAVTQVGREFSLNIFRAATMCTIKRLFWWKQPFTNFVSMRPVEMKWHWFSVRKYIFFTLVARNPMTTDYSCFDFFYHFFNNAKNAYINQSLARSWLKLLWRCGLPLPTSCWYPFVPSPFQGDSLRQAS